MTLVNGKNLLAVHTVMFTLRGKPAMENVTVCTRLQQSGFVGDLVCSHLVRLRRGLRDGLLNSLADRSCPSAPDLDSLSSRRAQPRASRPPLCSGSQQYYFYIFFRNEIQSQISFKSTVAILCAISLVNKRTQMLSSSHSELFFISSFCTRQNHKYQQKRRHKSPNTNFD